MAAARPSRKMDVAANTGRNRRPKAPPKTKFEEDVIKDLGRRP